MTGRAEIEKVWKNTCKVLLGAEIGELEEFKDYLVRYTDLSLVRKKSALSGEDVFTSANQITGKAKFIGNDEITKYVDFSEKSTLTINEIKDLDSILEALKEKLYYTGNIRLGQSEEIYNSDCCVDSSYIYNSQLVYENSRYVAFSNQIFKCEYCFGSDRSGESKFLINGYNAYLISRCMDVIRTYSSSDCYFTANMDACIDCLFSFNLRNKNHCVGNLQLPKEKYAQIKEKLIAEIRQELKSNKKVLSIVDLIANANTEKQKQKKNPAFTYDSRQLPASFNKINDGFKSTAELVLGRPISSLIDYEKWLTRYTGQILKVSSVVSTNVVYVPPISFYINIKNNAVTMDESLELGKLSVQEKDLEDINLSNIAKKLGKICCTTTEDVFGRSMNVIECSCYGNCFDAFRGYYIYNSKCTAYSYWPKYSDYLFGCFMSFHSKFCINCHNSNNLNRCFEMESCHNCNDCYFCHNCENLSDCMFCFNTKSKKYAVGNIEIGHDKYLEIKRNILAGITQKIEKNKYLELSIYNLIQG